MPVLRRIGHKGADHIAPGNTPASFDAALAAGVDMIEFDVLPEDPRRPGDARLVLAHDYERDLGGALTLEQGLAHLASSPFGDVELDLDLKLPGYEARVVDALREHRLVERTLVSTLYMRSLVVLRRLEPELRLGWSVPRVRRARAAERPVARPSGRDRWDSTLWALPAAVVVARMRRRLPPAAARHLAAGRCDAIMAHWRLVTAGLVRTVREARGELYVWTVDDPARIRALEALGVTGVITNDPRLFGA